MLLELKKYFKIEFLKKKRMEKFKFFGIHN
jgi:hypothetical protein